MTNHTQCQSRKLNAAHGEAQRFVQTGLVEQYQAPTAEVCVKVETVVRWLSQWVLSSSASHEEVAHEL